jgi:alginate O-acetyltransferase complex protein AlgI
MIIMAIAGIWHGAAWGFIVWGILHGLFLVVHRLTDALSKEWPRLQSFWQSIPGAIAAWAITQFSVFFAWIFFRLPDLRESGLLLQRLFGQTADIQFAQKIYVETLNIDRPHLTFLLILLTAAMGVAYAVMRGLKLQLNWYLKIVLVPLCLFAAWLLAPDQSPPFVYFDF